MRILILGHGNVGTALKQFHPKDRVYYHDPNIGEFAIAGGRRYDVAHITYPMTDLVEWVKQTLSYLGTFKVEWWMIHSTVDPAVFEYLPDNIPIVYSPIRATEGIMEKHLARTRKYCAFLTNLKNHPRQSGKNIQLEIIKYIEDRFPNPLFFEDARALALGKLFETADFGIQIALAQMMHRICKEKGYNFNEAYNDYRGDSEYGANYTEIGPGGGPQEWVKRAIFRPDVIGGKCVMQNIRLLEKGMLGDMDLWTWVDRSNERRKREELKHD